MLLDSLIERFLCFHLVESSLNRHNMHKYFDIYLYERKDTTKKIIIFYIVNCAENFDYKLDKNKLINKTKEKQNDHFNKIKIRNF